MIFGYTQTSEHERAIDLCRSLLAELKTDRKVLQDTLEQTAEPKRARNLARFIVELERCIEYWQEQVDTNGQAVRTGSASRFSPEQSGDGPGLYKCNGIF